MGNAREYISLGNVFWGADDLRLNEGSLALPTSLGCKAPQAQLN